MSANDWRRDRALWAIVALYVLLALVWNFVTPAFEAPDEPAHIQYVQYLAANARLPDLRTEILAAGIESPQPPAYYALAALVLKAMGNPAINTRPPENPRYSFPANDGGANRFVYLDASQMPVHLLRLVSTLCGIVTVLGTYMLAHALMQNRDAARLAAALTAFLPQFTFLSGVMNNDNLAAALGALTLFYIVRVAQAASVAARDWLGLGVVVGIALMAKSSLLMFLPIAALVVVKHAGGKFVKSGTLFLVGVMIGGGWFYARNLVLYGDAISTSKWDALVPHLVPLRAGGWEYFLNPFPQIFFRSYFGVFGWLNIFLPPLAYISFMALTLVAVVGLWLGAWRRAYRPAWIWALLFLLVAATFVAVLAWNARYIAPQGRLIFPALAAISTLLAAGYAFYPARWRQLLFVAVAAIYCALNVFALAFVYASYRA